MKQLCQDTEHTQGCAESFRNQLRRAPGREVKLVWAQSVKSVKDECCQTAPQLVMNSTSDLRRRSRELTASLQDTASKKSEMKRHKASPKEEEWVEPRRGSFWETAYGAKQAVDGDAEALRKAPIEHDPEVLKFSITQNNRLNVLRLSDDFWSWIKTFF